MHFSSFRKLIIALFVFIIHSSLSAQSARIFMDGDFSDWPEQNILYTDNIGDQITGNIDFGKLWIANDSDFLYLSIEVAAEISIQQSNNIRLYIDTDNNSSTGNVFNGIGAELIWTFGLRNGTFINNNTFVSIQHPQIGIVTMPTVTSKRFEIAIARNAQPLNGVALFQSSTINIAFTDLDIGQDRLPDQGEIISYTFDESALPKLAKLSLKRQTNDHLRILNYNVLVDGFFDDQREEYFSRIFKAIKPDIFSFQEIYNYSASQVAQKIEEILPSSEGQQWYAAKEGPDIIVISRYPILQQQFIEGGNGAFLIDLSSKYLKDLLMINAHPPCCSNDEGRQFEIDAIMSFIRDVKNGGAMNVNENTPIMIMGDMNLVGDTQQLFTLLTGDIINLSEFGPAFKPDWDESDLTALLPRTTGTTMFYTWYDESSSFSPGRLDFMIYTDSVVEPANNYVLFTPNITADTLARYGLQTNDAINASDHLPIVSDFIFPLISDISDNLAQEINSYNLGQNYPNPFNPNTAIEFSIPKAEFVTLKVYNLLGQQVQTLVSQKLNAGAYKYDWDAGNLTNGVYVYRLEAGDYVETRKMVLIK